MTNIVLTTINARYVHAALGLRYLAANMGSLQSQTTIVEFVLGQRAFEMVEDLLAFEPKIIGMGVYIWNVEECTRAVAILKRIAPEVLVVLGGPEVSYETADQRICQLADYVITGWGDVSFPLLATELMAGLKPADKIIRGLQPPLDTIRLPYELYTDEDIRQRFLYVEASRGCPFKCEFCLSALDKTAWPFELE
ncbi:MAG: cobalamin-dependent protein, partial [Betaproteobacteria bacterium]